MDRMRKASQESWLTAVDLVRSILAVYVSITAPAGVDTLPTCTLEVMDSAGHHLLLRLLSHTVLWPLVRPVSTVLVSIAAPESRHTHGVVALEGTRAAGGFGAGSLIWAVWTVVILVTNKCSGYTLAIGTTKLVSCALFGRCGETGSGEELM